MDDAPSMAERRTVLAALAGGAATSLAGCTLAPPADDAATAEVEPETARALAERFAPTVYFDSNERWYPTDPREFTSERDGRTVVDGFDAFDGYVSEGGSEDPPAPTAFYHVVAYEDSPLAVVQYWFYSVFDQFTTNFHWHDWELLQVFVDTETEEPRLYVASSHSRKVPNNEHLDPDPEHRPRVLSELGSHSSGISVNEDEDGFQRLPLGDTGADVTNSLVDALGDVASIPFAYGLPRDEGFAVPFAVPELDGAPIHEHDRMPAVDASDMVPGTLSFSSLAELTSPPTELPQRETGDRWEHAGRDDAAADVSYDLVPTTEVEHVDDFVGPQLSFEFGVPGFVEDLVAGHITTAGVPWDSPRYTEPARDISEPDHRRALAERYDAIEEPDTVGRLVARVTNAVPTDDAPEDQGLTTEASPLETVALLESEQEAVPTFHGIVAVRDVPEGEHRLTVNGAGVAPHSETVAVERDGAGEGDATTVAGVEGEIPVVAREDATKLAVDPEGADAELTDLAVEDDFAGRLYDAPLDGPDAVYVHRGGAFTTEVRDADDEIGAFRVNPGAGDRVAIDEPRTGKAPLARYLADVAEETRSQVATAAGIEDADDTGDTANDTGGAADGGAGDAGGGRAPTGDPGPVSGLARALAAIVEAAERAAQNAEAGDRAAADRQLDAVASRLETVASRLAEARGAMPETLANATDRRLEQSQRRAEQARDAGKL